MPVTTVTIPEEAVQSNADVSRQPLLIAPDVPQIETVDPNEGFHQVALKVVELPR